MVNIDSKDKEILEELQEDSKQSCRKLAKRLGMPVSTLCKRITALEKNKIISGYKAHIHREKVGFPSVAYIMIAFDPSRTGYTQTELKFLQEISKNPRVLEANIITGEYDIMIKVYGKNERDIGQYVVEHLREQKGIARATTLMIMYEEKTEMDVQIKMDEKM